MRMALGLDHPTAGTVTVAGRAYRDLPAPLRQVGALLDAKAVEGVRSARNHLRWLALAGGIDGRRVDEVLALVGLADAAGTKVGDFSLGMSQRLGVAAALLGDPAVLLFDEPVNGLDPEGIRWVRTLMRSLAAEGRTVLVSSHLMHEMEATADHVVVIGRGRLLADMPMRDFTRLAPGTHVRVVTPPDHRSRLAALATEAGATVTAGEDGALHLLALDAASLGDLAAAAGIPIHELTTRHASLEEAYIDMTHDSVEYTSEAPAHAGAAR
jgi:ABC-2 type transport system ATP-binding protein